MKIMSPFLTVSSKTSHLIYYYVLLQLPYACYLFLVYRIGTENFLHTELYGYWSSTTNFTKAENFVSTTALRRLDLGKYQISICYVLTDNDSINHLIDEV